MSNGNSEFLISEKRHNNSTIKKLTKTEWFNQFDEEQKEQISLGLKDNLNVSIYAKKEFNANQMFKIKAGLDIDVDVSIYAKPEISSQEMEEIRLKLLEESTL